MRRAGLIFFAIPFLAMAWMIASNEWGARKYNEYRVEVTGYDPVNILTGHYVAFSYRWPENAMDYCTTHDECFACFKGSPQAPKITLVPSRDIRSCGAALALENKQPDRNMMRYSVSEIEAPFLDRMLRERSAKFEVGVIVYPDHNGQVANLYLDGKKLTDFFK